MAEGTVHSVPLLSMLTNDGQVTKVGVWQVSQPNLRSPNLH